jgi:adenylate kinase family enzyme
MKIGSPRGVLFYSCKSETLEKRILHRSLSSGRADDNAETVKKRIAIFNETSFPVIEYYMKNQKCWTISAEGNEEEVYQATKKAMGWLPLYHDNIVFVIGSKLSGKEIYCSRLAKEFGLLHISIDDLKSVIDVKYNIVTEKDGYIHSNFLIELIRDQIAKNFNSKGFLIEGFPQTMDQNDLFDRMVNLDY